MKNALLVAFVIQLILTGCATVSIEDRFPTNPKIEVETDQLLKHEEIVTSEGKIVVRHYSSSLARCASTLSIPEANFTRGCTRIAVIYINDCCTPAHWEYHIYVRDQDDRETIRHELRHVYWGSYHG